MATMYRCVHFWGFKALEDASRRSDPSGADEMTDFQMTLCSVLVRRPGGGRGGGRTCLRLRPEGLGRHRHPSRDPAFTFER